MNNKNARCSVVFWVAVITAMACESGAVAQDAVSGIADAPVELDIQAQPIGDALNALAQQSGLQVVFFSEVAGNLQSREAVGEFENSEAALEYLLADTGLGYRFVNERTVAIQSSVAAVGGDERGDSDSKNLGVQQPVLVAQNQTSQAQTASSRSEKRGTSIVAGKVTDARTGANLKGAKVTIEETGQWTSTNDLGEFRLVNVPIGSATLTVSFLGYAGQSAVVGIRGDSASQNFVLRGGSDMEEIVVFGQRSARAQALNQERTADNIQTVVSSDLLGSFEGTTISEALRRASGVTFERDFATGAGRNIAVRGLAADFNTVRIDGVELPVGNGFGRSADLGNILADSVDRITINKTLLADQDSAGIGGLVEIETKSPLDRPERFANFSFERSLKGGDFSDGLLVSGTVSRTFGLDNNFGLSASLQYRESDTTGFPILNSAQHGLYLPAGPQGNPSISSRAFIDPRLTFPFESSPGADQVWYSSNEISVFETETENLALTLGAQWRIADHTDLRFSYQTSEKTSDTYAASSRISLSTGYSLQPVEALGGENRFALTWFESSESQFSMFQQGRLGADIGAEEVTDVYSLRGDTSSGRWTFDYGVGYTDGETNNPNSRSLGWFGADSTISGNLLAAEAFDPIEGRPISIFSRPDAGLPVRLFVTSEGLGFLEDASRYQIGNAVSTDNRFGSNTRFMQNFGVNYEFDHQNVKYIEFGVHREQSRFESLRDGTEFYRTAGSSFSDLGLRFGRRSLDDIGLMREGLVAVSKKDLFAVLNGDRLAELAVAGVLEDASGELDPLELREFTEEEEQAFYVQGRIDVGSFEFIGGVRFSNVDVTAAQIYAPTVFSGPFFEREFEIEEQFRDISETTASQSTILPRFVFNYRPSDYRVIRGGYAKSIARPQISLLSKRTTVSLFRTACCGPAFDQWQLFVGRGNPALKPSESDNFDVSFEQYFSDVGVLKLSGFYKRIDNLAEENAETVTDELEGIELPDHPFFNNLDSDAAADGTSVVVISGTIVNSDDVAEVWGGEVSFERRFRSLPGALNGLGVFLNAAYADSSKVVNRRWGNKPVFDAVGNIVGFETEDYSIDGISFDQSPRHSGTVALTYNSRGLDGTLSYTFQDSQQREFAPYGLAPVSDTFETLDLSLQYQFDFGRDLSNGPGTVRIQFQAADILSDASDTTIQQSVGGANLSVSYLGGRSFVLGVSATF